MVEAQRYKLSEYSGVAKASLGMSWMQDREGIFGPPGVWWCSWQSAWYRRAGRLWIPYVDDDDRHEATRQFVRRVCWYGDFDQEIMARLAVVGADGSMEVGPHGFPLSFMNVLAQGHPDHAHVDVVRMIMDLGQSPSDLDKSCGAAPLHYVAGMCGECSDTPKMARFLLDHGASPNLWCKHGMHHEPHGGVEGDALGEFTGSDYGDDYLIFPKGACLILLHLWEDDPRWAYGIFLAAEESEDRRGWFPADYFSSSIVRSKERTPMQILADAEVEGPDDEPSFFCRICDVKFPIRNGQILTEAHQWPEGPCTITGGDPVTYLGPDGNVLAQYARHLEHWTSPEHMRSIRSWHARFDEVMTMLHNAGAHHQNVNKDSTFMQRLERRHALLLGVHRGRRALLLGATDLGRLCICLDIWDADALRGVISFI